ncbi:hypothetical protein, partial [Hymenobacter arcticus]
MTGSLKKQFRKQFGQHRYPVKTFRGDPTRPAYTLYNLWEYPTHLAASNELDELLDQWPRNWQRTVALLAVQRAFYENGPPHWAEEQVWAEDQTNVHALMLRERQRERRFNPTLQAQHVQHTLLAHAALAESQRRKQGPPTGRPPQPARRSRPKHLELRGEQPLRQPRWPSPNEQLNALLLAAIT